MQLRLSNIKAFPLIAISIVLAVTLLVFGAYVMIPAGWLGMAATTAYPNMIARSIFGIFMAAPAVPILYCNVRYDLKTLIKDKMGKLRPYIFWMGVTYFYVSILRVLTAGFFPPIFIVYLALATISFIIWFNQ